MVQSVLLGGLTFPMLLFHPVLSLTSFLHTPFARYSSAVPVALSQCQPYLLSGFGSMSPPFALSHSFHFLSPHDRETNPNKTTCRSAGRAAGGLTGAGVMAGERRETWRWA